MKEGFDKYSLSGQPITVDVGSNQLSIDHLDGSLTIAQAQQIYTGTYVCETRPTPNAAPALRNTVQLTVDSASAQIQRGPSNQTSLIGYTVVFPCELAPAVQTNDPMFRRQWFYNDQLITAAAERSISMEYVFLTNQDLITNIFCSDWTAR